MTNIIRFSFYLTDEECKLPGMQRNERGIYAFLSN